MRVLAVETSTLAGGAAIVDGDRVVGQYLLDVSVTHSERLMVAIDRLLGDAGWAPRDLEGLGAVIAKHFAQWPLDVVLSTGPGALILSHCVARAHPSRPIVVYGTKGLAGGKRRVSLPVEFQRLVRPAAKVLLVEDLVSTGSTLNLLINLVEQLGAQVVGIGCLWRRTSVELAGRSVFSLVSRDFPTYDPAQCPLCKKGVPLNEEFVRRRHARKPSSVQEPKEVP